jgi:hypothetical protein
MSTITRSIVARLGRMPLLGEDDLQRRPASSGRPL